MKNVATDAASAMRLLAKLPLYKQHRLLVESGLIMKERTTTYGQQFRTDRQRVGQFAAGNLDYCQRLCDAVNRAMEAKRIVDRDNRKFYEDRRRKKIAVKVSIRIHGGAPQ